MGIIGAMQITHSEQPCNDLDIYKFRSFSYPGADWNYIVLYKDAYIRTDAYTLCALGNFKQLHDTIIISDTLFYLSLIPNKNLSIKEIEYPNMNNFSYLIEKRVTDFDTLEYTTFGNLEGYILNQNTLLYHLDIPVNYIPTDINKQILNDTSLEQRWENQGFSVFTSQDSIIENLIIIQNIPDPLQCYSFSNSFDTIFISKGQTQNNILYLETEYAYICSQNKIIDITTNDSPLKPYCNKRTFRIIPYQKAPYILKEFLDPNKPNRIFRSPFSFIHHE